MREPLPVLQAEAANAGLAVLFPLARSADPLTQAYALRAIGRLENPEVAADLLPYLTSKDPLVRSEAANALAQSLKGLGTGISERDADLISRVENALIHAGASDPPEGIVRSVGRLPYQNADEVKAAEVFLAGALDAADKHADPLMHVAPSRALETLARLNPKLVSFDPALLEHLSRMARRLDHVVVSPEGARRALGALITARALDAEVEHAALQDNDAEIRRVAVSALAGGANPLSAGDRVTFLTRALEDPSSQVRLEAVRGYAVREAATHGCGPILDAFRDDSMHVVLAAIDALGDQCRADDVITDRIVAEARTPPTIGSWHRESHALVALAKRARDRAAISLEAHATHQVWQVRMYAARAAAAMDDVPTLNRLAYDEKDNVRDATLQPLWRLEKEDALAAILAALLRTDYQLLRTAALLLKDAAPSSRLAGPLIDAVLRVTMEGRDTARDTRLALLDAVAFHGERGDAPRLTPLLKDFDPKVAARAAEVITGWTGKSAVGDVQRRPAPSVDLRDLHGCVAVSLKSGATFRMSFLPDDAPLTGSRFLRLALVEHYYDGLTFHRIVPNFVIQGGSPGANEYTGSAEFMRDEISMVSNARYTVGLSTRGRNTGDAQFYINLVDNPRLDFDYTVFGIVVPQDAAVVDGIIEGDQMVRIGSTGCPDR